MKHPVRILIQPQPEAEAQADELVKITMQYGQTIGDLISELINTCGHRWIGVKIMNIHDKQLPNNMLLRGDMTIHALLKFEPFHE